MTTVKRNGNLTDYTTVLPYASEMFGVYQPLIGWKSKRIEERFNKGASLDKNALVDSLKRQFTGVVQVTYKEDAKVEIQIKPGIVAGGKLHKHDSVVLEKLSAELPDSADLSDSIWAGIIKPVRIDVILEKDVVSFYTEAYARMKKTEGASPAGTDRLRANIDTGMANRGRVIQGAFEHQLQYESSVAGALLYLVENKSYQALKDIFYASKDAIERASALIKRLESENGGQAFINLGNLNPRDKAHLDAVALSPISVVHLFRQYFFELDTFLGPPVSHVWLSPGSSVELIEIHTRKSTTERSLENTLDLLTKSEKSITEQEEISEAVKENNQQDIKFGASVKASYGSIEATSSFDYGSSQQLARESTHKRMREQSDKLSSEIRKNFKSTFKTITEFTDISSTKHVLANTTQELINYELRRKMRQVGVQVQDIGTFLCWQTYVDDPGKDLGLSKLVHIAKPAELDGIPHPEEIPMLQPFQEEKIITIPFISVEGTGADNEDEVYIDGVEADDSEWFGSLEKIQADFAQEFVCSRANFELANVEFDPQGQPVQVSRNTTITNLNNKSSFGLHLDSADFQGKNSIQVKVVLHWAPNAAANDIAIQKNKENIANFKEAEKKAYEKAYIETVKDRVTTASKINSRKSSELREEERIVVYRKMVQDMLLNGIPMPDDRTRHVVAELLNAIFDMDKMLYFVAPEWWRPRLHRSQQQLHETGATGADISALADTHANTVLSKGLMRRTFNAVKNMKPNIMAAHTVGWGGLNESGRDNYFITDESEPAKLGSSLGWLMQLDGDNMRNAFLNAPWVKAVIPIRPGKEEAAINWLKGVEGMNGITDDVVYHTDNPNEKDTQGNPLDGQKMMDVLTDLAKKIRAKYLEGIETGRYPKQSEVSDPALVDEDNTVTATPIDRVYEHGFFPLEGSFRANVGKNYEIFDQWTEILPTDQVVPVPVKYDPRTGRQLP